MRPSLRLPTALVLGAALTACGSTVPVAQRGLASGTDGLGYSLPGAAAAASSAPGATGPGAVAQGLPAGTAATGTAGAAAPGRAGTAVSPGSATPAGPRAAGTIEVGITYVKDAAAGAQALGFQGATLGDMHLYASKLVDDINAHGGLGGRKVVPVYFAYDVNPGTPSYDEQDQAACAALTQDRHVEVAVVNFAGTLLQECLRKKGVPMVLDGPGGGFTRAELQHFDQLFVPGGFNLDRRAEQQVPALVRQKYFASWDTVSGGPGAAPVKVGVVTYDLPGYAQSVNGPLTKALVAAGYPRPEVVTVAAHDSYGDLSKMQSQIANAVIKFRADGITHVIVWDDNGVATLFFLQNAENQRYRPRYGINTGNNMQTVAKVASANQLRGATGMGWNPSFDIAAAKSPTSSWANSARRACYALMQRSGVSTGQGFNETSAMSYCSALWLLRDGWNRMAHPSAAGLAASLASFGSSFVDPLVPATWLSPRQHDGNSGTYDLLYDESCSCMAYRGGVHPLDRG